MLPNDYRPQAEKGACTLTPVFMSLGRPASHAPRVQIPYAPPNSRLIHCENDEGAALNGSSHPLPTLPPPPTDGASMRHGISEAALQVGFSKVM